MKTKRELKCCVKTLVNFNLVQNLYFNRNYFTFGSPLMSELMPRFRQKPISISDRKYSSFWFALKAIQNNKLLRNNSSLKPLITQNRNLVNGFTDENTSTNNSKGNKDNNIDKNDTDLNQKMDTSSEELPKNEIKVIEINSKKSLVLLESRGSDYELGFGCLKITLLSDNFDLDLNGFTLTTNQSIEVMAAFGHKIAIQLKAKEIESNNDLRERLQTYEVQQIDSVLDQMTANSCIIVIEKILMSSLLYIENIPEFKGLNLKPNDWFDFRSVSNNNFDYFKVWDKLFDELNLSAKDIIIVCGGQNVGKSSLIRYLINRYLSKERSEDNINHCLHLDCDPGQSEFSTAAQISLTKIERPVLSSTPTNVLKNKPLMSCSVGANNASKEPKLYISSVTQLVNYFRDNLQSKGPLFINTMGWTRDLGLSLLTDLIKIAVPTHVLQMDSIVNSKINFAFDLTPESVRHFHGFHRFSMEDNRDLNYKLSVIGSDNRASKKSQLTRVSQQLTYFSQMPEIAFKPFFAMTPFKILWSKTFLHIISDTRLSSPLYLDILNCSWIQLCRINEQSVRYSTFRDIKIVHSIDGNQCLGSGVVRSIDFKNKCFYILSPESPEVLESVNCIVRPFGLEIPQNMITEQLNYSSMSTVPYIYDNLFNKNHNYY